MCLDNLHKDRSYGSISPRSISLSRNLCVCESSVSFHWPSWAIVLVMLLRQKPWWPGSQTICDFNPQLLVFTCVYRSIFRCFIGTHFIPGQNWTCPLFRYVIISVGSWDRIGSAIVWRRINKPQHLAKHCFVHNVGPPVERWFENTSNLAMDTSRYHNP